MVKVEKVKAPVKKGLGLKSNSIKKKGTLSNNLKASKRRGSRQKAIIKKKKDKGVVYLSHIPHGFYDEQIEGFFGQFGKVTQVSVPKSKSGRAKGYAFIEFVHPEVAKIAAETMNNYLMFNRLLKAKYIPPQDQKPRLFKKALAAKEHNKTEPERAVLNVKANRKKKNLMLKTSQEARVINQLQKKSKAMSKMMAELGVTYEIQVEQGNCESVFKRMKNLEEKRRLEREEELKRKQADAKKKEDEIEEDESSEEDSSSEEGGSDENLSCSASNDGNLISSKVEKSSKNINQTDIHKSKAPKGVLNKPQTPVSETLVINPSKLQRKTKSARGSKIKPIKSNQVINKPHKENTSQALSFKVRKPKQNNLQIIKSSQQTVLPSQTIQKKPKDLQKQITPSAKTFSNNIHGQLQLRKSPEQQPNLLPKQKSPAKIVLNATKRNLLEAVKEDSFKPTPTKKLKQSELKETIQSPTIRATQKSRQTPSKMSPKPSEIPKATVGTPKRFNPLKKSESGKKSPIKRKIQNI